MQISHAVFDEHTKTIISHPLSDHLAGVATLAEQFAQDFHNGDWGKVAGLLHDLGKGSAEFQKYIRNVTGFERGGIAVESARKWPHAIHGALWAYEHFQGTGKLLAYVIAGHHGGLPDYHKEIGGGASLHAKLRPESQTQQPILDQSWIDRATKGLTPPSTLPCGKKLGNADNFHLWLRMLFSSLVDADFLNTERFMDSKRHEERGQHATLQELKSRFDHYMADLESKTQANPTEVNGLRQQILGECRTAAALEPGFFGLTVPTGGGKTLSGMAFALDHAILHQKERVIIAIPYTSIIEQTAAVYKHIFGEENVIEHHSSLDPAKETLQARLASENWDAPIIVTTNVQLFESLFASRTSKCRKLHNIVSSVTILDEAQMLPPDYLRPILAAMQGLVDLFDVSLVLSTATQPALTGEIGSGQARFGGISTEAVREIISAPEKYSRKFQRVEVEQAGHFEQWPSLATELAKYEQVLCVVNTRKDCRELHQLMPPETILLSANLCGEHRSVLIGKIKECLIENRPIRVISTQLVEAGVDIDFPVVYRALAGFDSIAQAAGRCNREGKLRANGKKIKGHVVVFEPPQLPPPGFLRKGAASGAEIMRSDPDGCRNLTPEVFKKYFQLFYGTGIHSFDKKDMHSLLVQDARSYEFQFKTAARNFKLIDDQNQVSVVVWYEGQKESGQRLIGQLKRFGPSRQLLRKMQRFSVTIPEKQFMANKDCFEDISGVYCQAVDYAYDKVLGFVGLDMSQEEGSFFG